MGWQNKGPQRSNSNDVCDEYQNSVSNNTFGWVNQSPAPSADLDNGIPATNSNSRLNL